MERYTQLVTRGAFGETLAAARPSLQTADQRATQHRGPGASFVGARANDHAVADEPGGCRQYNNSVLYSRLQGTAAGIRGRRGSGLTKHRTSKKFSDRAEAVLPLRSMGKNPVAVVSDLREGAVVGMGAD
jgi:hypothetical protein